MHLLTLDSKLEGRRLCSGTVEDANSARVTFSSYAPVPGEIAFDDHQGLSSASWKVCRQRR